MLYCVGGVSGSGKTDLIRGHAWLRQLHCIDIADFYTEAASYGTRLSWHEALDMLDAATRQQLDIGAESLVLEALFKPGSAQRRRISRIAQEYGQQVSFIWCYATREECRSRVNSTTYESARRRNARLNIISQMEDWCFMPVPGEGANEVLDLNYYCP